MSLDDLVINVQTFATFPSMVIELPGFELQKMPKFAFKHGGFNFCRDSHKLDAVRTGIANALEFIVILQQPL